MQKNYLEILQNPATVPLSDLLVLEYSAFCAVVVELSNLGNHHVSTYYAIPESDKSLLYVCVFCDDERGSLKVLAHRSPRQNARFESLTPACNALHIFEREIHENYGVDFLGHPWLKPVRYANNRFDPSKTFDNYPFFRIDSAELHEVGVGPVHAGVIEPGHFRFICSGEKVHHLEIHLGYQHRGVEKLMVEKRTLLQKAILSESIAGDTAVGHSLCHAQLLESLSGNNAGETLQWERVIALELERIAVHIGDTAALCGDIAYQLGQVVCESLRTLVINTTQYWCGNRFGKGFIRVGGSQYPLSDDVLKYLDDMLRNVGDRYNEIAAHVFSMPGALTRFDGIGVVTHEQGKLAGLTGMSARMCGIERDVRKTHPFQAYKSLSVRPVVFASGDVLARALVRRGEINASISIIREAVQKWTNSHDTVPKPDYQLTLTPDSLCISLAEGWRGEIFHAAITDSKGAIRHYKVTDPSMHNWTGLALAVRNQEISDFPVCNKSFNLSYCGFDL